MVVRLFAKGEWYENKTDIYSDSGSMFLASLLSSTGSLSHTYITANFHANTYPHPKTYVYAKTNFNTGCDRHPTI
jgi:hypothetical protein